MTLVLELWVEGSTDAALNESADQSEQGGALPPIVRRTLAEQFGKSADVFDRIVGSTVRVTWLKTPMRDAVAFAGGGRKRLSLWTKKLLASMDRVRWERPHVLIVAIRDRDGDPGRIRERDEVNNTLREMGLHGHAAAVCIEEVEAWLFADLRAIQACFGKGPESDVPGNPETIAEPKEVLRSILKDLESGDGRETWSAIYHKLAQCIDLQTLANACPKGYGKLREDLKILVLPRLNE